MIKVEWIPRHGFPNFSVLDECMKPFKEIVVKTFQIDLVYAFLFVDDTRGNMAYNVLLR